MAPTAPLPATSPSKCSPSAVQESTETKPQGKEAMEDHQLFREHPVKEPSLSASIPEASLRMPSLVVQGAPQPDSQHSPENKNLAGRQHFQTVISMEAHLFRCFIGPLTPVGFCTIENQVWEGSTGCFSRHSFLSFFSLLSY